MLHNIFLHDFLRALSPTNDWPCYGIKTWYSNIWPINQIDQKTNNLKEAKPLQKNTELERYTKTKVDLQRASDHLNSEISQHTQTHSIYDGIDDEIPIRTLTHHRWW